MKRAFIIHGWGGCPEECWFPWLKMELEKRGFQASVPQMPNTDIPKIGEWVGFLKSLIKNPDEETYLIGHSIGCQTIMRYLETLPENTNTGKVVFVAGFINLIENCLETPEEDKIAEPWLKTPIDFKKIKKIPKGIIAIFSDNDPYVPLTDSKIFKEKLNAKIIILKNKGHINEIKELPEALNVLK